MRTIFNFCIDAQLFLTKHYEAGTLYKAENIQEEEKESKSAAIALHCKAGKGRTGLMVICFLLFSEHDFADN